MIMKSPMEKQRQEPPQWWRLERRWATMNTLWSHPLHRVNVVFLRGLLLVLVAASSPLHYAFQAPALAATMASTKDLYGLGQMLLVHAPQWTLWQWLTHCVLVFFVAGVLRCGVYALVLEPLWNWPVPTTSSSRQPPRDASHRPHAEEEEIEWFVPMKSFSPENSKQFVMEPIVQDPQVPQCFGSWSGTLALVPFGWFLAVQVLQVFGFDLLQGKDPSASNGWTPSEFQLILLQVQVLLSAVVWMVCVDLVLQDRKAMAFPRWWLGWLKTGYNRWRWLRVWCNWICLIGVVCVVFGTSLVETTQRGLMQSLVNHGVLLNESWRIFLTSVVLALDVVILFSDSEFPTFATPRGTMMFGFWSESMVVRYGTLATHRILLTAKWLFGFLMLVCVMPLDVAAVVQEVSYRPTRFGQQSLIHQGYEFQVVFNDSSHVAPTGLPILRIDNHGLVLVPMRFFRWPEVECLFPGCVVLVTTVIAFVWLAITQRGHIAMTGSSPRSSINMEGANYLVQYPKRPPPSVRFSVAPVTRLLLYREAKIMRLYTTRAKMDMSCCLVSLASILLAICQLRTIWQIEQVYQINSAMFESSVGWNAFVWPGETHEVILWGITLYLWVQIYRRNRLRFAVMYLRNAIPPNVKSFWSIRSLRWRFLCEMVVNSLWLVPFLHGQFTIKEYRFHPPTDKHDCPEEMIAHTDPKTNATKCFVQYQYNYEILNMVTLVRFYWLARAVRSLNHLVVFQPKSILMMGWFSKLQMQSISWNFRVLFSMHSSGLLTGMFVFLWLTTSSCVCIFERPLPSHLLETESHGMWLAVVTMASVGYGDSVPMTLFGRMIIFVGSVLGGALFFSLLTSLFLDSLKGSKEENRFVSVVDKTRWQRQVRKLAISLITVSYQRHQVMARLAAATVALNTGSLRKKKHQLEVHLFGLAQKFRVLRKNPPCNAEEDLIEQIYWWENQTMKRTMDHLQQQNNMLLDLMEAWVLRRK